MQMALLWPPAPARPPLEPGQIHVWAASLEDPPGPDLEAVLDAEEHARADRFHFAEDRQAYVIAHGVLRRLIESYVQQPAGSLRFKQGPHGKPHLAGPLPPLHFNLAHTRGLAVLAFTRDAELGVDVEWQGRPAQILEIAARYFTSREQKHLAELPEQERIRGFFHGWTRKEALLKACGLGLSVAPESVDVSIQPGQPARVYQTPSSMAPAEAWSLIDLRPSGEHIAALATIGPCGAIERWTYRRSP